MTNVRSAASEKRRRAILAAALDCFVRDGVAATTMEDIRAASGASIGSIYHHFESKELLAAALYLEGISEYQDGLLRQMTRHAKARDGIRGAVAYHLGWIKSHPNWARFCRWRGRGLHVAERFALRA
jgi:AcrR family transcriptional regulator